MKKIRIIVAIALLGCLSLHAMEKKKKLSPQKQLTLGIKKQSSTHINAALKEGAVPTYNDLILALKTNGNGYISIIQCVLRNGTCLASKKQVNPYYHCNKFFKKIFLMSGYPYDCGKMPFRPFKTKKSLLECIEIYGPEDIFDFLSNYSTTLPKTEWDLDIKEAIATWYGSSEIKNLSNLFNFCTKKKLTSSLQVNLAIIIECNTQDIQIDTCSNFLQSLKKIMLRQGSLSTLQKAIKNNFVSKRDLETIQNNNTVYMAPHTKNWLIDLAEKHTKKPFTHNLLKNVHYKNDLLFNFKK